MYPFIPNAKEVAFLMKEAFEDGCPGLTLQIVMDSDYYSSDKHKGILYDTADVTKLIPYFSQIIYRRIKLSHSRSN